MVAEKERKTSYYASEYQRFYYSRIKTINHGLELQDIDLAWIYEWYEFRELTEEFSKAVKESLEKENSNG